jgi:hypothetical protein
MLDEEEHLSHADAETSLRAPPPSPIDFPLGMGWVWERDEDVLSVSSRESS